MTRIGGFVLAYTAALAAAAHAQTFTLLHSFQYFPHGASPYAPLYLDPNGNLYGTTSGGGPYNAGVVFKLDPSGSQTVLHTFTGGADGGSPCGGLAADSAGNLYGTAYRGGAASAGVVYEIDTSGQFTVLYSFAGGADGSGPFAGVILDSAGNLYGTTYYGGIKQNYGVVYKLSPSGQETVLHSFKGSNSDGANPFAGLAMDSSGNLHGTTYGGGRYGEGTVYELSASGNESVLFSFGDKASGPPQGGVTLDAAGNMYFAGGALIFEMDTSGHFTELADLLRYGAFPSGLARDASGSLYFATQENDDAYWPYGAVLKLDTSGKLGFLYEFKGAVNDSSGVGLPIGSGLGYNAGPILDPKGNLYGTTPFQGSAGVVYKIEAGGAVKRLYDFDPPRGGYYPWAGLTLDAAGNLYGTTAGGGGPGDNGVVYKLDPSGKEAVLHTFGGGTADGAGPRGGVVLDEAGNLYGATAFGGASNQGVIYKLTPSGLETILADIGSSSTLAMDSAGDLYGTTYGGGANGRGSVFKVDTSGNIAELYSFTGGADGGNPEAGVTLDSGGNLYGTTFYGGIGGPGAGVVFKIDTTGAFSVLHAFLSSTDGGFPYAGVTLDATGNTYGTCSGYGPSGGGTVFKIDTAGNFSVVYAFAQGPAGYGYPQGGVAVDRGGDIYGTLDAGSSGPGGPPGSYGQVYEIDTSGTETVFYSFTGGTDGAETEGPAVTLDGQGHLYGVSAGLFFTPVGGGTAFRITLP